MVCHWWKCVLVLGVLMISVTGTGPDSSARQAERDRLAEAVQRDIARHRDAMGRDRLSVEVDRALRTVPRHRFVPQSLQSRAYDNRALPIGQGQTISQPTIVAMMTDLLALAPGDTVLEVGTGSGYQAAVLAAVLPRGHVHTIEIVTGLADSARALLAALGCANVTVYAGDGYRGLPDLAPFAGIMVTAAAGHVPAALVAQLKPGGRLVMPLGPEDDTQWLTVLEKQPDGRMAPRVVLPVRFVPMTGEILDGPPQPE